MRKEPQISPLRCAPVPRRAVGPEKSWACGPHREMKNVSVQQPRSMKPLPFPLSSRAKSRDLQFRGPFVETLKFVLKQKCHLACSGVPWERSGEICGST
jgi:hypothetical protein